MSDRLTVKHLKQIEGRYKDHMAELDDECGSADFWQASENYENDMAWLIDEVYVLRDERRKLRKTVKELRSHARGQQ